MRLPVAGHRAVPFRQDLVLACPGNRSGEQAAHVPAGVHADLGAVGCSRTVARPLDGLLRPAGEEQWYRHQPHDAAVAGGKGIDRPAVRLAGALEKMKRPGCRAPNVETRAGAAQVSLPVPAHVPLKLVRRVEPLLLKCATWRI